ncbi:hypothetical protein SAMN07250955_106242 [Arboricoccus pini]|uniref:YCII-related domain-containing protein n=1 Tax=Arboricoccus pini TaxID=1963835 RepID=A0A212R9B1_9PROT|nr:YciI family protein [Arboricoccus pini]SNB68787.1 hypothetical protein SAMN07250955_106242 [Arboricoccus pini]
MPYMIETFDKDNHQEVRAKNRPEHLEFLRREAAKLLACGAKLLEDGVTATGSFYIVDVETRAEAETFLAADPYSKADLFKEVRITKWRKAILDRKTYI